jgi:hypothetical protein
MELGTLYMIVTLPNGQIRTRAYPNQPIDASLIAGAGSTSSTSPRG